MFLRNVWYVAAWSTDLAPGASLGCRIVGEPIALFRTASGALGALEDRCIHRGMALSDGGECEAEIIRCPYHGLEYDRTGACTKIPGQDAIPRDACVRSYPVVERDAMVWIWPGEPRRADPTAIPEHPYHDDPAWAWSKITIDVNADWQLFNDNLLDLSHLGYVHKKTIGGDPETHANAEMTTTRDEDGVHVRRWLLDSNPPPFYKSAGGFTGRIDRWQEIDFRPGFLAFYTGATDTGTGAYEGRREGGVHIRHMHGITPVDEHRTRYFFAQARNFNVGDPALTERLHELARVTFLEDKAVLEIQQARVLEHADRGTINIRSDAGGIHARRLVAEAYEAEQRSAAEPVVAAR
jgi:phenylpropionate dioxygenase-like ring-hydroxylating dioxygenase large terminal subunit